MLTRMVWLRISLTSPARATIRRLPSCDVLQPERHHRPADVDLPGHDLRVVPGTPPVASGLAFEPVCFSSASRIRFDDEPGEENATVLPSGRP